MLVAPTPQDNVSMVRCLWLEWPEGHVLSCRYVWQEMAGLKFTDTYVLSFLNSQTLQTVSLSWHSFFFWDPWHSILPCFYSYWLLFLSLSFCLVLLYTSFKLDLTPFLFPSHFKPSPGKAVQHSCETICKLITPNSLLSFGLAHLTSQLIPNLNLLFLRSLVLPPVSLR